MIKAPCWPVPKRKKPGQKKGVPRRMSRTWTLTPQGEALLAELDNASA